MESYNVIWPKGLYNRNAYMLTGTETISSAETIINEIENCNSYLWIRNTSQHFETFDSQTDLDIAARHLHLLKQPVHLITSDGDRAVPSSYDQATVNAILDSDKITSWHTQNYDRSIVHKKLKHYPIGLDLHTERWLVNNSKSEKIDFLNQIRDNDTPYNAGQIFCDAHLSVSHPERDIMYNILRDNQHIEFLNYRLPFIDIIKKYRNFKFVVSPRGNGEDCHRTWELLLLGCIVITRTSSLDDMWAKNNLPVVVLQDWEDLNDCTEVKLDEWYHRYNQYTSKEYILPKFTNDYWLGVIHIEQIAK